VNANGNGPWSNVASATTPGVVASYPDSYTVRQGKVLTVAAPGVLQNDTNAFGLPMTAELVSGPAHGSLALNSNGGFTYTPLSAYSGSDSFQYRPWDGTRYGPAATVTLTVTANQAPVAVANSYTITQGSSLTVTAPGLLGNDFDPENDTISCQMVSNVFSGVLTLNANGSFNYSPFSSFSGTDSFQYRVFDGISYSAPVTVNITVTASPVQNLSPVPSNDSYSVNQDTVLSVSAPGLLANDSDPEGGAINVVFTVAPSHGSLAVQPNGAFVYTPNAGYFGADSFTYKITDGVNVSGSATVSLTVNQTVVNAAPVASPNSYTISEDQVLVIPAPGVLQNDTDPNGDPLTAILQSSPTHGTLSLNSGGGFTYTPAANYNGTDSFTYKASDGSLQSSAVTVTITINPVADPDTFASVGPRTVTDTTATIPASASWGIFPDGTLKEGASGTTPSTNYGTWLTNTIDGVVNNPGAYEIRATTSDTLTTHGGMALGVWNNLATARTLSATSNFAGYASVPFTIDIRPVNGAIINTTTITLVVDTSAAIPPGGGGGGGGGCVWVNALLADNSKAGFATIGHDLTVLDEDGWGYHIEPINTVTFGPQPCATLVTESGIELTCSYSTPIAIRKPDGTVNTIKLVDCLGREVPVLDNGEFRWEPIVAINDAGSRAVALINVNDGIYAAGNEQDRFIFTHNVINLDENKV
jgi:VCBS repeat-containing protein